jgi:Na+/glutamate symporter
MKTHPKININKSETKIGLQSALMGILSGGIVGVITFTLIFGHFPFVRREASALGDMNDLLFVLSLIIVGASAVIGLIVGIFAGAIRFSRLQKKLKNQTNVE